MYAYAMLKSLRQHHSLNMLPTYVATKHTTNELPFDTYVKTKYLMECHLLWHFIIS